MSGEALAGGTVQVVQATRAAELQGVRDLIREFTNWAFSQSEEASAAPTFSGLDKELAALPGKYGPPTGCLLLATSNGEPAGCVAIRRHDDTTAEIKRMYVRPAMRGRGVGGALLNELIATARRLGYGRMVLTTHPSLASAQRLYQTAGFAVVHNPENFPTHEDLEVCMEMTLTG